MHHGRRNRRALGIGALIAAVVAAGSITAIGAAAPASSNAHRLSGTLTMFVVQGEPFQSEIADFEAKNPGVHINLNFAPPGAGYGQALVTLLQAGNAPDIFYVNPGTGSVQATGLLGPAGKIVNLYHERWVKQIREPARSLWVKSSKSGKTGTVWAYPFDVQGVGLTWNDTEFQKLGLQPPKTWSQLLSLCGKIKALGKQPLLISGLSPTMPVMNRAITDVYAKDPNWNAKRAAGKVTFAGTPGWVKTMSDMKTLADQCLATGWSGLSVPQVFGQMAAGNALMAELPTGATASIVALNPSNSFKSEPFPGNTVKSTIAMAYWADALAISSTSKNIPAAKAFLEFLSHPNEQAAYAKASFTVAPIQAATGQNIPEFMSAFAPYFKTKGKVFQRPYDVWSQPGPFLAISTNTTAFLLGKISAHDALAGIDHSWGQQTAQP